MSSMMTTRSNHSAVRTTIRRSARRLAALAVVVALPLAACGDDDGVSDSDGNATTPDESIDRGDGQASPTADLRIRHLAPQAGVDNEYHLTCAGGEATLTGVGGEPQPDVDVDVDAVAACDALGDPAVVERLTEGPPEDQVCTEVYGGEDAASIEGTIDGVTVDATVDRTDGCGIADWDELLAPILPEPVGVQSEGDPATGTTSAG
jgi:hypothetical protein